MADASTGHGPGSPGWPTADDVIERDGNFVDRRNDKVIGPIPATSDAQTTGRAFALVTLEMEAMSRGKPE